MRIKKEQLNKNKTTYNRHIEQKQPNGYSGSGMKKIKGITKMKKLFTSFKKEHPKEKAFYVVKVGKKPGIYVNQADALDQITNFPNGKFKKITGYPNALQYFQENEVQTEEGIPNVYIDGSYLQEKGFASYGFVVEQNEQLLNKDCGTIYDYDLINLQSLGAELFALLRAMEWGMANDYKQVHIIYDSEAVIKQIEQIATMKAKRKGLIKFQQMYAEYRKHIRVTFSHKTANEKFEKYHEEAHHLSRLTGIILSDVQNLDE